MGLYLEIYTDDYSQRAIVKVGNYKETDEVSFRVDYTEPGAEDAGIVDRYSHHTIKTLVRFYRGGQTDGIYKIKSKLELTRVLLMFEWEKLRNEEPKDTE